MYEFHNYLWIGKNEELLKEFFIKNDSFLTP